MSDPLNSAAREPLFSFYYILTSYGVSITEQTTPKCYLFLKRIVHIISSIKYDQAGILLLRPRLHYDATASTPIRIFSNFARVL